MELAKSQELHTYADYLHWHEGRWEIIAGEIFNMTPAPARLHQKLLGELFFLLQSYLKKKNGGCEVYPAPFDVRLGAVADEVDDAIDTVVQPDIVVVCDPKKLDERGCNGAPDLVVEILSPSTAKHDLKTKRQLYEQYGVKEYWLVQPVDQILMVYILDEKGCYNKADIYGTDDELQTDLFADFVLKMNELFGIKKLEQTS